MSSWIQNGRPRARAGALSVSGNVIGAGAAFLAAIIAARVLDFDEFAAFGVGIAVSSLAVQFGDLGLGVVAVAETSESTDPRQARRKLKSLTIHRIVSSLLVVLLIEAVVVLLPSLEPYRAAAMIGAAGGVFGGMVFFTVSSLQAHGRFGAGGAVQIVQGVLRLALVAGCAIAGLGSSAMMAGYAIVAPALAAVFAGVILYLALRAGDDETPEPEPEADGGVRIDVSRRRLLAVSGIIAALTINGDVLLLTTFGSPAEVAEYAAAWRFGAGMLIINTAIAGTLLPFVMKAEDAWQETGHLIKTGLSIAGIWLLLTPLMYFVGIWILGPIGEDAKAPLFVLLIAFAIDGFYFAVFQIYLRIRRVGFILATSAVQLLAMVSVTLLLQHQGSVAPAIGQLAARVAIVAFIMIPVALYAAGRIDWFSRELAGRDAR